MIKYDYNIYNKKILTVVWILKEWKYFLEGVEIPVEV